MSDGYWPSVYIGPINFGGLLNDLFLSQTDPRDPRCPLRGCQGGFLNILLLVTMQLVLNPSTGWSAFYQVANNTYGITQKRSSI